MPIIVKDAKLCLLTCPFEPPKPKTKHKLDITSKDAYEKLFEREQKYFADMVQQCKDVGTNLVRRLLSSAFSLRLSGAFRVVTLKKNFPDKLMPVLSLHY